MRVMLLAAGRGERLRPLTDRVPKPLLPVGDRSLIEHHIARLAAAGFREFVINTAHLGAQLVDRLGDGRCHGVRIDWSHEPEGALDTGGGIAQAWPLLGHGPCVVVSADIFTDYDFRALPRQPDGLAHLVLVDNPSHHPSGDFQLHGKQVGLPQDDGVNLTYSGIAVLRRELFSECDAVRFPLAPLLRLAAMQGQVTAEHHHGVWLDVGTPERLAAARALVTTGSA
ncbi:MAG: nucleotidyltransferase family protein [Gammaproteobacteria bacterium]|nr:nucleotidyltransferase family protein [Gammaproteobacteria bacterium]